MVTDLFGKACYKVNLHMHTNLSDGRKTPEEAARIYRMEGYDALCFADHWFFSPTREAEGITVLSGIEYDCGENTAEGIFHIVGLGCAREPAVTRGMKPEDIIRAIHQVEGLAVVAHPAWSLNTPEQILSLPGVDAIEIYNTVSGVQSSRRPDSSLIVDMLGARGHYYPLIAADDTHMYDNSDACKSFIVVRAESENAADLLAAIRRGDFYASQGPEVHIALEEGVAVVTCSPVEEIVFLSDMVWSRRVFTGEGITRASYKPRTGEKYIRAVVKDQDGKQAWTQIIPLNQP